MSCTNSLCLDQLLEPEPPDTFIILNNNDAPAFAEFGAVAIPTGATSVVVVFGTAKVAINYQFNELAVENTLDITPLSIEPLLLVRSLLGFTVGLSGATDTANYVLKWNVEIVELT